MAVNAAGCGSAMKEYAHLLRDDPEWARAPRRSPAGCATSRELLAEGAPRAARGAAAAAVAYHDACHLAHAQGIRAAPRALLRASPASSCVEPAEAEICCGSAGIYNLLQPEPPASSARRKAASLLATGAGRGRRRQPRLRAADRRAAAAPGAPLPVDHPVELLDASIPEGAP